MQAPIAEPPERVGRPLDDLLGAGTSPPRISTRPPTTVVSTTEPLAA